MDAEFRVHLQMQIDEYVARGMDRASAAARAHREFGAMALAKDECRDARGVSLVDDVIQDARYALRSCRRNAGFTTVAVLTLSLGIGANSALFSVVNGVLLRPLPFPEADRLVSIWENVPASETPLGRPMRQAVAASGLRELRRTSRTLADVEAYGTLVELRLGRDEDAEIPGARVSATTLSMLGATPQLGRLFNRQESAAMDPVLVLSAATWRRYFGSDPGVIGRPVTVEGTFPPPYGVPRQVFTVIGVMAEEFRFPSENIAFWIPLNIDRAGGSANIARIQAGLSRSAAEQEVNTILLSQRKSGEPAGGLPRFEVVGLQDELVGSVRPVLRVLFVAAALVLLIVCSNVANLLLARATVRAREVSLRMALGAGRGRIVRQMVTEGTVLALLGGVVGTLFAFGGVRVLRMLFESLRGHTNVRQVGGDVGSLTTFPRIEEIGIDVTTLAFTAGVCLLAGVFFGLAPALRTAMSSLAHPLRDGSASAASGFGLFRRHATRSILVVGQVALAVTVLIAGGVVVRSFVKLITTDAGFDQSNVLTFQLRMPRGYTNRQVRELSEQLVERASSVPGVRGAAYGTLPLVSRLASTSFLVSPSEELPPPPTMAGGTGESFYTAEYPELRLVSRDYLRVMGMRIVAGHDFEARQAGQRRGLIINETLARTRFPSQNPVGRDVYFGPEAPWVILGVVADVRQQGLDMAATPQVFVDFGQWDRFIDIADDPGYYAVRTDGRPQAALVASLRDIVQQLNGQAMLDNVATMEQLVDSSIARPRLYAVVLGLFAMIAVVIAAVGVYGVMAYAVVQNTREIGVRMALGARARQVLGLVVGRAAALTGVGIVLGFAGAVATGRFLRSMIFGLPPHDMPTYLSVAVIFSGIAMLAAFVPALRATRVNPLVALRAE